MKSLKKSVRALSALAVCIAVLAAAKTERAAITDNIKTDYAAVLVGPCRPAGRVGTGERAR